MKNIKHLKLVVFSALVVGSALTSCRDEDFGADYNKDEYGIYKADYKSLLSGAIMDFGQNGGLASNANIMMPNLFVQYQSQVLYTTEQTYGDTPGAWSRYYVNQLKNLNAIITAYATPTAEMALQGSPENMIGVSKIMRAIIMKRITDTYGDVPFTEANMVDAGIYLPKYDKQEALYDAIFADLKSGRDMINTATTKPTGDILYYGNLGRWQKLANSVLLQASLQLSKKYPSVGQKAANEFNAALANPAGVIENIADEAWFTINPSQSYPNPVSAFRAADYRISRELVESMKGSANTFNKTSNHTPDRRLTIYAQTGTMAAVGLPYGYTSDGLAAAGYSTAGTTTLSTKYRSNNSPISLMTSGYTYLNRAEAAQRGWTAESATAMLTLGITRNYETLDNHYVTGTAPFTGTPIAATYAATYAAARVVDMGANALQVIGEEKWIALYMSGFDSWSEFRRTNYPALTPAPNAVNGGVIPTRIRYPQEEVNFNNANYLQGAQGLLPAVDKNTSKVWWNQ